MIYRCVCIQKMIEIRLVEEARKGRRRIAAGISKDGRWANILRGAVCPSDVADPS